MKKALSYTAAAMGSLTLVLSTLLLMNAGSGYSSESEEDVPGITHFQYNSPFIPKNLDFAGENVPLNSHELFERIDREFVINSYWHSNTILNLKRSAKYFKAISTYLKEEGVPDDFKYLAVAESGLTNAVSPAGAVGFWQFMEGTAVSYGLEVNSFVDERADLERSTRAACAFIKEAYRETGSWTLAAAAFNRGLYGIQRALKNQKVNNYYDLYLNKETSRYIPRLIAIKYISLYPSKYGFSLDDGDTYTPVSVRNFPVSEDIPDLVAFAKDHGATYNELKLLNPWLISERLPKKEGKIYTIQLPK